MLGGRVPGWVARKCPASSALESAKNPQSRGHRQGYVETAAGGLNTAAEDEEEDDRRGERESGS